MSLHWFNQPEPMEGVLRPWKNLLGWGNVRTEMRSVVNRPSADIRIVLRSG